MKQVLFLTEKCTHAYTNRQENSRPAIPRELRKNRRQWVCHNADKEPVNPRTGKPASSTDPNTWGTYEEARGGRRRFAHVTGIGYVLQHEDRYVVLDFDHVRDPATGEWPNWVVEIVERFRSYTEISPSGTGLHIWIRVNNPQDIPNGNWFFGGKKIEVYEGIKHDGTDPRYMTVTGRIWRYGQIQERTGDLKIFLSEGIPPKRKTKGERHEVDTEQMCQLFAALGIHVDPLLKKDERHPCPFHSSSRDPQRGGRSLLINPTWGWKCWSGCGAGGAGALEHKIADLSDDQLKAVATRTGKHLQDLEDLRLLCRGHMLETACHSLPSLQYGQKKRETVTPHLQGYLEHLSGPGTQPPGHCGVTIYFRNRETRKLRARWCPCNSWGAATRDPESGEVTACCPYCGAMRRAAAEVHLLKKAEEAEGLYYLRLPEDQWEKLSPACRQVVSRAKRNGDDTAGFVVLKVGLKSVLVFSGLPLLPEFEALPRTEWQQAIFGALLELRQHKLKKERLLTGSNGWVPPAAKSPSKAVKEAEDQEDYVGIGLEIREAAKFARIYGHTCEIKCELKFPGDVSIACDADFELNPDGLGSEDAFIYGALRVHWPRSSRQDWEEAA